MVRADANFGTNRRLPFGGFLSIMVVGDVLEKSTADTCVQLATLLEKRGRCWVVKRRTIWREGVAFIHRQRPATVMNSLVIGF
jgi:hypothetical protein